MLSKDEADSLPETLVSKARSRVKSILQIPQEDIDDGLLYRTCDEIVVQSNIESVIANRDIYIYREGFYRGLTVSLVMLFLSLTVLTVRMLVTGTSLRLSDTQTAVSWPILLFVDLILLIGAWLSFRRYRRFGGYRIRQAIIGFLVLDKPKPDENKPANEPGQ